MLKHYQDLYLGSSSVPLAAPSTLSKRKKPLKEIWESFKALLYPPSCLLCHEPIFDLKWKVFCQECFKSFARAEIGFEPYHDKWVRHLVFAFENEGSAAVMLAAFKTANRPYLAEGMGALMVLQWLDEGHFMPDLIVPVPSCPYQTLKRGYRPSLLLAEVVAKLLRRPLWKGLRQDLEGELEIKGEKDLQDKQLLLVDDVLYTGNTLKKATSLLLGGYPRAVDALIFSIQSDARV